MFDKIKALCVKCGEQTDGKYVINGKYYCHGHYNEYFDKDIDQVKQKSRKEFLSKLNLEQL